ncbi:MAG: methyl-accepting chemotaxis protein [Beijerinckiaceae bacterium]|nr:methyl-accepting chemotaxis protein [Beijerinckiaceae bacterium]
MALMTLMPRKKILVSLSTKYTLALLIPLAVGIGLLSIVLAQIIQTQAEHNAEASGWTIAAGVSASLEAVLDEQMAATRTMRDAIVAAQTSGAVSRAGVAGLMRRVLEDNPAILGVWSCWEPDAIDGRDRDFVAKPGSDAKGRFANYVVRHPDGIRLEPLTGYDATPPLDYYAEPKRSLAESVVEPYGYEQDGHWLLLTTFAEPIVIDGKFAGAVGSDIDLGALRKIVAQNHPLGTGRVSLVSAGGLWISDAGAGHGGKAVGADDPALAKLVPELAAGRSVLQRVQSAADGGAEVIRIFTPLAIGRTGANWSVMVTLPVEALFENAHRLTNIILLAGELMALIFCVTLVFCTRRFIGRPLREIANGLRDQESDAGPSPGLVRLSARTDEIGMMARSMLLFGETQIEKRKMEAEAVRTAEFAKVAVDNLATGLNALAQGDLTIAVEVPFSPVYEMVRNDFNLTVARLRATIGEITTSALHVGGGTSEISRASEELARRTELQAVNLEETAASLDGITRAVLDTAERSQVAKDLTESAKAKTQVSIGKVQNAIAKMAAIEETTAKVVSVLAVIQGVAAQSNLLALNATIEAARAGQAGSGFAVVALEVRELARRSAEAAKNINQLIEGSTANVREGVALVDETGDALNEIAAEVANAYIAVASIAESARDQANSLRQANAVANELDQLTQRNAAMAEETTAAASALEAQSAEMLRLTGWFRVGETAGEFADGSKSAAARTLRR